MRNILVSSAFEWIYTDCVALLSVNKTNTSHSTMIDFTDYSYFLCHMLYTQCLIGIFENLTSCKSHFFP